MISMVEKITRLGIKGCERQFDTMKQELQTNCDAFLNSEMALDFERDWMGKYI